MIRYQTICDGCQIARPPGNDEWASIMLESGVLYHACSVACAVTVGKLAVVRFQENARWCEERNQANKASKSRRDEEKRA